MDIYFDRCLNGPPFEPNEDKKFEFCRLISFKDWSKESPVYPLRLAQAGFHFTGKCDEVVCHWCGTRKESWEFGEDPWTIHQVLSPDCAFFSSSENIPISPIDEISKEAEPRLDIKTSNTEVPENVEGAAAAPSAAVVTETLDESQALPSKARSSEAPASLPALRAGAAASSIYPRLERFNRSDSIAKGQFDSLPSNMNSGRDFDIAPSLGPGVESLRYERKRLETFKNWPRTANVPAAELARCGFYYTGSGDRVQCIFCKGILRNWEEGDRPHIEHRKHFPKCSLVLGLQVGNVPLPLDVQNQPASGADSLPAVRLNVQAPNSMASLGIMTEKPKHPQYAVLSQRLGSFKGWPASKHQTPAMLAESGFWYAGFSDNVKCFFCDGGLRNWETGDEPWSEHAKWFPKCPFLRQVKGDEFIQAIQQNTSTDTPILEQAQKLRKSAKRPQALRAGGGIEEREIRARMDRDYVRVVERMGISQDQIKKALRKQLTEKGDDFPTAQTLLEAVFRLQEEERTRGNITIANDDVAEESMPPEQYDNENQPSVLNHDNQSSDVNHDDQSSLQKQREREDSAKPLPKSGEHQDSLGTGPVNTSTASASNVESPEEILRENLELKEQRMCKICMVGDANVVFLPCGHLVSCAACSPALTQCPICRAEIRGTIRTYLA